MSPEDELLITKAMLMGCPLRQAENGLWYAGLGSQHPMSLAKANATGKYGYNSATELAHAWIDYFERSRVAQ